MKFPLVRWPKLALAFVHTRNPLAHRVVALFPHRRLVEPIWVVGLPRSGTSIFTRTLAYHRELAHWSEAPVVWDRNWRAKNEGHRWTAERATPKDVRRIDNNFAYYTKWKGKKRFINKHPRNSLRVPFLMAGWPDAWVVNLIRDPRAIVHSLVERTRAETWRAKYPLGQFARPPGWEEMDKIGDDVEKFSRAVAAMHETLRDDIKKCVPPKHLIEVRYEDFAADGRGVIQKVWKFCGLGDAPRALERMPEKLENMNYKWAKKMTPAQIETMRKLLTPMLIELGYETSEDWKVPSSK